MSFFRVWIWIDIKQESRKLSGKDTQYVAIVKNSNFQISWNLESGNSRKMRIQKFWVKNQTQWTKLSGKNTQYVAICQKWSFPDFLEYGIWKFQENDNSKILSKKSRSLIKIEWEIYPICCNLSKTAISESFQIFWNLESGNLEILEIPKNAKKYSKIDLIISFF